jgi:hypothetical protein
MIAPFSRAVMLGLLLSVPVWFAAVLLVMWLRSP